MTMTMRTLQDLYQDCPGDSFSTLPRPCSAVTLVLLLSLLKKPCPQLPCALVHASPSPQAASDAVIALATPFRMVTRQARHHLRGSAASPNKLIDKKLYINMYFTDSIRTRI